ncbi:MAG: acyl-CoA carboxylase epsilon subunit [Acidimicrobiia bacterium]
MADDRPRFRVIDANASAEEVAAIVATLTLLTLPGAVDSTPGTEPSRWVAASRLAARRSGSSRGEWRLSGRIGRRARA